MNWKDEIMKSHKGQSGFFKQIQEEQLKTKTMKLSKYKQNLKIEGNKVISYVTHVATINHAEGTITQLGYWGQTTQKHINYVADELSLTLIKEA